VTNPSEPATARHELIGVIAQRLRVYRGARGLSASALARRAGIAPSTVTQLEASRGNPGIETLWALANALVIPFAELIAPAEPAAFVVRAGDGTITQAENSPMQATYIAKLPAASRHSLYRLYLSPNAEHVSSAHRSATTEHLYMVSGTLTAGPDDERITLRAGDYMRYPANTAHRYQAGDEAAEALLIMGYD